MPPRRRIVPLNAPIDPLQGGKAGNKDPRNFISGNAVGQQWDEIQFAQDRSAAYDGRPLPAIADVSRGMRAGAPDAAVRTIPTRVTMIPWTQQSAAVLTPILLVPRNPRRLSIQIGNGNFVALPNPAALPTVDASIFFSWGIPPSTGIAGFLFGHLLSPGMVVSYQGDTCPIDDLYVWVPTQGIISPPVIAYVAYEGVEAPEGNQ